ncbi:hypothetical protein TRVL_06940 [Trypanosoma vivax]|uniref:Uncharacterized protein n=1 Tax=Trypanosoma vivax (strain Y486) TaxID=1055687 RepID=G0U9G4_TRYVY|nr:hypothetical protein TRVL_06940 [Trypanosoma vivax]CCC54250.1 hypothetical protein TVY486_1117340 [Trypanosoma vivax Y486]
MVCAASRTYTYRPGERKEKCRCNAEQKRGVQQNGSIDSANSGDLFQQTRLIASSCLVHLLFKDTRVAIRAQPSQCLTQFSIVISFSCNIFFLPLPSFRRSSCLHTDSR